MHCTALSKNITAGKNIRGQKLANTNRCMCVCHVCQYLHRSDWLCSSVKSCTIQVPNIPPHVSAKWNSRAWTSARLTACRLLGRINNCPVLLCRAVWIYVGQWLWSLVINIQSGWEGRGVSFQWRWQAIKTQPKRREEAAKRSATASKSQSTFSSQFLPFSMCPCHCPSLNQKILITNNMLLRRQCFYRFLQKEKFRFRFSAGLYIPTDPKVVFHAAKRRPQINTVYS